MKNLKFSVVIVFVLFLVFCLSGTSFSTACGEYNSVNPLSTVDENNDLSDLVLHNCTSMAAGRLATVGGYTMSGHTCDGSYLDFRLEVVPAAKHSPGEFVVIDYPGIPGGESHDVLGKTPIPQVPYTYKWFKTEVPIGNEYQVFIGENTCSSRSELETLTKDTAWLDWFWLPALGLQRGKTAREVVETMGFLVEHYGLRGDAESFLISDPYEAWVMEIPGWTNEWVAERVPDDQVAIHANRLKIQVVDLNDTNNFLASPNLIKLAQDRGFYNPATDGPFNFEKVYSSKSSRESLGNRRREWRMVSLLCPSQNWDPNAIEYPFSVKPEFPISVEWWINNVWRDSYEGTPFDLTKGIAAGPFGNPIRQSIKGLSFERAIATPATCYSWVSQARSWLPDPIGGVFWHSMDSGRNSIYVPFYVGITDTPTCWRTGDMTKFSSDSAWWWFQALDTISQVRYNEIHSTIRESFDAFEKAEFEAQKDVEQQALNLYYQGPFTSNLINPASGRPFSSYTEYLTYYSSSKAEEAKNLAQDMFFSILLKYRDGLPRTTVSSDWMELLKK